MKAKKIGKILPFDFMFTLSIWIFFGLLRIYTKQNEYVETFVFF